MQNRTVKFGVGLSIPSRRGLTPLGQTDGMLRALLLLLVALGPIWLVYTFGFWLLVAFVVLTAATFVFSTGKARGPEETQGGRLTGYHTTTPADF
jgi:hypothetical protein